MTVEHGKRRAFLAGCRCDVCKAVVPHGLGGYLNWKCRCPVCGEEHSDEQRRQRERRLSGGGEPPEHGLSGHQHWGCRCPVCKRAFATWDAARLLALQEETRAGAKRHYQEWTGPELELAAREDLTAREVALMLGRTYQAVTNIRRRLGDDPRLQYLAGLVEDE